ncbi:MAG TPA: CoA pyrophosphatase [Candidatus Tectomicrobia bacterium]|nr:CoA pyrophosphatase [Candidatus Tectomicrobia bacterium]
MSAPHPADNSLQSVLMRHVPSILPPDASRRQAAVLLPLFKNATDYHLLFTKRTDTLRHHKGQIAFPGGSFEPADGDLLNTALRESYEEVGIQPEHVSILGRLDDLSTFSTNYTISPFVGLIPYPYPFRPNPVEVAIVFDVPVSVLADPAVGRSYLRTRDDGATIEDYEFYVNGQVIWGATARIVRHLLSIIHVE